MERVCGRVLDKKTEGGCVEGGRELEVLEPVRHAIRHLNNITLRE